jgi:hypothetical protein
MGVLREGLKSSATERGALDVAGWGKEDNRGLDFGLFA